MELTVPGYNHSMTCIVQTQHSPRYCLLTPLMSPKDKKCNLIVNQSISLHSMSLGLTRESAYNHWEIAET